MTTNTVKKKLSRKRRAAPPVPKSADRAVIAGTDFILMPYADFTEWYEDQILAAVAADRLKTERNKAISWEEVKARLSGKRKGE